MKIVAVQAEGHYVRLGNCSQTEQDIGGYYLQQSIRGQPVNCFLFPPRTFIQPGASITVSHYGERHTVCHPCQHSKKEHPVIVEHNKDLNIVQILPCTF